MHPLDGPRLKVVRAREHLNALKFQQGRFFESDPYSISDEFDAETGKHVYRIHVLHDPPTHRLAALLGDCVHNLRSALDHLAWRLSEDFSGPNDADTATQFPIFRTEAGYKKRGVTQIVRVGPGAAAVILLLQPFHEDEPRVHPLWFIRELDNRDKHRELAVTAVAAKGYAHRIHPPKGAQGTFHLTLIIEDIHDGEIIAELVISPPEPQVRVETRFEFEIALTTPTVPHTDPRLFVVSFLDVLAHRVSGAINCFEPFYASGTYDDSVVLHDPLGPFHAPPPKATEPAERTDEAHAEWAKRARERLKAGVDETWAAAQSSLPDTIDPAVIEEASRAALLASELNGFLVGTDMTMERIEDKREELGLGPDDK